MIVKKECLIGDIKKFQERLLFDEGIKRFRFFKRGRGLITALKMIEFKPYIVFDKPSLYIHALPIHDAPFVLQSDRIIVKAENEAKANELIGIFISEHGLK